MRVKVGKQNSGITLIALVITIIVLLILAGISIATLTGENGVLTKASTTKEESKKAEYKEILELIGNGLKPEKVLEQLDTKPFMDRYEGKIREKVEKEENLEGATIERTSDSTIRVTTKEGYVYEITENEVKYLGKYGENTPPDLQKTDIDFILEPAGYTIQNVMVEVKPKINIEGYILQYSTNGSTWNNYTEKITFKENGTIHARLINEIGETGKSASKEIDTIDREGPNQATITFSATTTDTDNSITATVTQTDKGNSGVDFANSRWKYSTESGEIGTNPSSYTGGTFSKSPETITLNTTTPGTYYLHVLTVDKAGNKIETIKGSVTVAKVMAKVGVIVTENNKEYEKNGTAIIPVGFAIVPGCDDISRGLVISDVANDTGNTGNQFVWIPVTNPSSYVKNTSYPLTATTTNATDWSGFLPNGITNEKQVVTNAKGFYIARYETGQGLVSKKGVAIWNGMTQETAVSEAKKFVQKQQVKSALISGTQWDATMAFINGKTDGTGNTFNIWQASTARVIRNPTVAGGAVADYVCNIYDLEGNYYEYVAEKCTGFGCFRGRKSNGNWFDTQYGACFRDTINGINNTDFTFRMVLYVL